MRCEKCLQLDIGKFAGLGQPIHAMLYLNINVSLVYQQVQVVVVNDLNGKDCHQDVHVCIVLGQHGDAQVKIFEVTYHAFCLWCGHNAIE